MNHPDVAGMEIHYPGNVPGETRLAEHRYIYSILTDIGPGEAVSLPLNEFTALVLKGSFLVAGRTVAAGQVIRASAHDFEAQASAPSSTLLVAGVGAASLMPALEIFESEDAKRVVKPWGYELWLSGEGMKCSLKKIFLRRGNRTSLQYHRQKRETNLIFSGTPELSMKLPGDIPLDDVGPGDIGALKLRTPVSIDIRPLTLHRLRADSDLLMYEASTPELDDVVRVADDSKRGHGRISSEH